MSSMQRGKGEEGEREIIESCSVPLFCFSPLIKLFVFVYFWYQVPY